MRVLSLFLFLLLLVSCKNQKDKNNLTKINLQLDWFLTSTFCGEIAAVEKFDSINGLNLSISQATEGVDPIKTVLGGSSEIGVVSADKYLAALEKGAPLKFIAIKNPISPTIFISRKEKNILTLNDFKGKRVGVLPGGSTLYIYEALIKKSGLNKSEFTEVQIPFDLGTFLLDKYDVRPAFAFDEPISLQLQNIDYNIISPSDFNVNFAGGIYFTTEKYYNANTKTINQFVKTLKDSWDWVFKNQAEAVELLALTEKTIDKNRELKALELSQPYFIFNATYVPTDISLLKNTLSELKAIGEIKSEILLK